MLKMDLRKLINYFSSKSRIERKEKIIAYKNKKYNDYSDAELQLKIDELEDKEKNTKGILSFINVALLTLIAGVITYVFKRISLFILTSYHLKPQQMDSVVTVQLGQLIDIGMGGIFILMLLIIIVCYNIKRNNRATTIRY
ncbi:hypothetical protein [Lactiplantibacillus plantarum]|uniref:hypothetical protein n=1 Tax=Lactiplantibacillus plantarum TaxID=1590 RepID=UPI0021A76CDF|nr:hypothetical protein [Lactiplantibacillus plantarum]MCT3249985.1 hypothetical protein [Lactiplantibacillus plantarum]